MILRLLAFPLALGALGAEPAAAPKEDSCVACHKDEKFRIQNKKLYDYYREWDGSAHDRAGLSCSACHGGDPAKPSQEEAHQGVLPRSNPESPFHFRNIPKTCGGCHPLILERYEKSRHFERLKAKGEGPSCVNCHGSLNTRVYRTSVVERACSGCHSPRSKNHPEVVGKAREILDRLNHANGYRKGLEFYYKEIGKPEAMGKVDRAYADIVQFWHEFDFKRLGPRSQELLAETKALYQSAQEERHKRSPAP